MPFRYACSVSVSVVDPGVAMVGSASAQRRDGNLLPPDESGQVVAVGCLSRGLRIGLATFILGTTMLVPGTLTASPQPRPQPAASRSDPAVDAYTTFVQGKRIDAPVDRAFVVAALDRLVSATEVLALTRMTQSAAILSSAHKVRREIRRVAPTSGDTPAQIKGHIDVFVAVAHLVDDVARALAPPGAPRGVTGALLRAADGLDFDYPLRWQANNMQLFLDLASRTLTQIVADVPEAERGRD